MNIRFDRIRNLARTCVVGAPAEQQQGLLDAYAEMREAMRLPAARK